MGFFDWADNPLTSLADSFVKNVFMDTVKPEVGCILKVDLAGGLASHTGVYIGNNEIVELYENDGVGEIRIVSPKKFLNGEPGSAVRTGMYIYCACIGTYVLSSDEIAKRAKYCVGDEKAYGLIGKNCHAFVTYCITGEEITHKKIENESLWTLMGVEKSLAKYFERRYDAGTITWRSTGSANGRNFE